MAKKRGRVFDDRVKLYPYVTSSEAAHIFGVEIRKLNRMLVDGLGPHLRFDRTNRGKVFRLEDVYRAAYPDIPDEVLYPLCVAYMKERHAARQLKKQEGTAQ